MGPINFENANRKFVQSLGCFSVLEYMKDLSVSPNNAVSEYFMTQMNVHRRQVVCNLNGQNSVVAQAGAMQWMAGNVQMQTGVKGAGDFFGKMVKGVVTKETAVKPIYTGVGTLVLEPTYKYILLLNVGDWGQGGVTIEDGMFLACDGTVENQLVARSNLSSAVLGNEGLFNLSLYGQGVAVLESNVPQEELIEVQLNNDELRIDGNLAVCWSTGLQFTVEKATGSFLGSAATGEGLVNVYRGTGSVFMSPVASTRSLAASTGSTQAKPAAQTSNTVFGGILNNL